MEFYYKEITTGDGSPTVRLQAEGETMHAQEGAFTETLYIYQPTVENAFKKVAAPAFISVGLGLGYNEILIACEALRRGQNPSLVVSYESVEELRDQFQDWLRGRKPKLAPVYERILERFATEYKQNPDSIKTALSQMFASGILKIEGALDSSIQPPLTHGILFDAFSSKTSPELWSEDFLNQFFKQAAQDICFISTYACTGRLRRALIKNRFTLDIKKGFGVKRESTFASKSHDPGL